MTSLARLGKDHMFLWAWGINGCFSVIGAALVPIVATSFGLAAVLMVGGVAYLVAMPAFFAVLLPLRRSRVSHEQRGRCGDLTCSSRSCWRCQERRRPTLAQAPKRELAPLSSPKTRPGAFDNSPFPYRGEIPEKSKPFIDVIEGDRRGHTSPRGGIYWEDQTYSDRRSLLLHPARIRSARGRPLMVVFFHGNEATLDARRPQSPAGAATSRRVRAQRRAGGAAIRRQRARFQRRPILGAGRVSAVSRRGDRAADRALRRPACARSFLRCPRGDRRLQRRLQPGGVHRACRQGRPSPARRHPARRACSREVDKFADWLARRPPAFFVSAYGKPARDENASLQRMLTERGVRFQSSLPASSHARQRVASSPPTTRSSTSIS